MDLLHPLTSKLPNRNESIIIEYDGFINSLSERVVRLMELDANNLSKYPMLKEVFKLNPTDVFNLANLYTMEDLDKIIFNKDIEKNNIILKELMKMNIIEFQQKALFEYSIYQLLQQKYIKNVSIIKKDDFFEYELDSIYSTFGEYGKKISVYTGDTLSIVKDKEFTTICTSDFHTIENIIKEKGESAKDIFFILRNNSSNLYIDISGGIQLKFKEDINKLIEGGFFISRFFSNAIDDSSLFETNTNPVG